MIALPEEEEDVGKVEFSGGYEQPLRHYNSAFINVYGDCNVSKAIIWKHDFSVHPSCSSGLIFILEKGKVHFSGKTEHRVEI